MNDECVNDATQMVVVDLVLPILAVSNALLGCLGFTRDELLGQSVDTVVGFDRGWLGTEVQALQRYGSWHGDVPMRQKDGRYVFMVADVELRTDMSMAIKSSRPSGRGSDVLCVVQAMWCSVAH